MSHESAPNLWPYSQRDSEAAARSVPALFSAENLTLSEEEKQQYREFSSSLLNGQYGDMYPRVASEERAPSLPKIAEMNVATYTKVFYVDYLDTEAGQHDLHELGLESTSGAEAFAALSSLVATDAKLPVKARSAASIHSSDWCRDLYVEQMAQDPSTDAAFHDPESFHINFKPDALLGQLEALVGYRTFYRQVARALKQETEDTSTERLILSQYVAKVNAQVAGSYANAQYLREQLAVSPRTEKVVAWESRLRAALPVLFAAEDPAHYDSLARRLDLIRNGAVRVEGRNNFGAISTGLAELADSFTNNNQQVAPENPEFAAYLQKQSGQFKAEDLSRLLAKVLQEWELFSEHETGWEDVEERTGAAGDNRWQVVISPKAKTLTVSGIKKVMLVPESFSRTLFQTSPSGMVPVAAHELAHVLQNEMDERVAQEVPLADIKGRRHLTVREMGGLMQESQVFAAAGIARTPVLQYIRALQAKEQGGNKASVVRASYEAHAQSTDDAAKNLEARRSSYDRALRLYRNHSHNSQPLDYLEQERIQQELRKLPEHQVASYVAGGASFSLADAAELRRHGLLSLPEASSEVPSPAATVLRIYFDKFKTEGTLQR